MRTTLRRSCDACAKAKLSCDLRTPQCSRCIKRKSTCAYANEPLTTSPNAYASYSATSVSSTPAVEESSIIAVNGRITPTFEGGPGGILNPAIASFDPFDSYPPARLPRVLIQRLIHHFLSNIAFQYYPLDLNPGSNPFIIMWWPRALADPALFHVSLQTASLDQELRSRKGFPISELLMTDSVSLVRRRIEDSSLAIQDETMNSVVTLAAIEVKSPLLPWRRVYNINKSYEQHGKGNFEASRIHIDGVKRIVSIRGGINEIKRTSPLTARMVPWTSLLVTGVPQFETQDDFGCGSGIESTLQWQLASMASDQQEVSLDNFDVDPAVGNILARLRSIFHEPQLFNLTTTELHDLTCFVVHKLLLLPPLSPAHPMQTSTSECLRYALVLYMLNIHGTTYYSCHHLVNTILVQLKKYYVALSHANDPHGSLGIWLSSVGIMACTSTTDHQWFMDLACAAAAARSLHKWEDVLSHLQSVLWVRTQHEAALRGKWEEIISKVY
ncbi:hypothetical protein V493_00657 [Pseudogymnoascus sp. VKM F-4281 (FW-2241)]|nr:hypothetical protein V493_00657 [Pseudogymnoascus sp. VKM F-4281 (FW-2241)]